MIKKIITLFLLILTFNITLPINAKEKTIQKGMLEIRDIQTRYYDIKDEKTVLKAVITTLQDNGFIIQNIEDELGYMRAKKEIKLKRTNKGRVAGYTTCFAINATCLGLSFGLNPSAVMGMYQNSMQIKNEVAPHTVIYDSNVTVETIGNRVKVRFNVIEKVLENGDGYTTVKSSPRKVVRHYEPEIYQDFFNQLDKNLFLEQI